MGSFGYLEEARGSNVARHSFYLLLDTHLSVSLSGGQPPSKDFKWQRAQKGRQQARKKHQKQMYFAIQPPSAPEALPSYRSPSIFHQKYCKVKCPIMSPTKSSHWGHYETSVPAIWDIARLSYVGIVWDHLGHYKIFSRDTTGICRKIFFGRFAPPPPPL